MSWLDGEFVRNGLGRLRFFRGRSHSERSCDVALSGTFRHYRPRCDDPCAEDQHVADLAEHDLSGHDLGEDQERPQERGRLELRAVQASFSMRAPERRVAT